MALITTALSPTLLATAKDAAERSGTSLDRLINAALGEYLSSDNHRIYQISTSTALVEGVYAGAVPSTVLLQHGDFGLGTFEDLDGEMVILDGVIYQVLSDGRVLDRKDSFPIPFAVIARFREEASFEIDDLNSLEAIQGACNSHRESDNLFYALRLDGVFDRIRTRAVGGIRPGTKLLEAAKAQKEFEFTNIEGTLVCIWSPSYSSSFNVPGYHFHFLSKDRAKGGHVLDCSAKALRVGLQTLCEYDVQLPNRGEFLSTDLSKDPTAALKKAE